MAKKNSVEISIVNNTIIGILDVLLDNGFIKEFNIKTSEKGFRIAEVLLKYAYSKENNIKRPVIWEIQMVSKLGRRVYSKIKDLRGLYNNLGIYILSTSKGIMSDKQARKENVGGEVICKVF